MHVRQEEVSDQDKIRAKRDNLEKKVNDIIDIQEETDIWIG